MARTKAAAIRHFQKGGKDRPGEKKFRWKPGTVAKREIRRYQVGKKATTNLVPKASRERLIREITQDYGTEIRFKSSAIAALQTAAEDYLVDIFSKSNTIRAHCKRETLSKEDIQIARSVMSTSQ